MTIADKMQNLLSEAEEGGDMDMKKVLPQLVLAMEAMGMDPADEEHQKQFIGVLKALVGPKKAALMKAMKSFSGAKASKALKAAKASV
jgi:hypothetical protein